VHYAVFKPLIEKTGGFLELTLSTNLHVEAILGPGHDVKALADVSILLSLCPVLPSAPNLSTSRNGTGCALVCFPVGAKNPLPANRRGQNDAHTTQIVTQSATHTTTHEAMIALHISSDSFNALGFQPANGRDQFYLPFGWIDLKAPIPSIPTPPRGPTHFNHGPRGMGQHPPIPPFRSQGQGANNFHGGMPANRPNSGHIPLNRPHHGNMPQSPAGYPARLSQGLGQGPNHGTGPNRPGQRPNQGPSQGPPGPRSSQDQLMYDRGVARGVELARINSHQQGGVHNGGRPPPNTFNSAPGASSMQNSGRGLVNPYDSHPINQQGQHYINKGPVGTPPVGDWNCPACKCLVFSFRPDCFRCHTLRPNTNHGVVSQLPPQSVNRKEGEIRDGDWNCRGCKCHNFVGRLVCSTCRKPRSSPVLTEKKSNKVANSNVDLYSANPNLKTVPLSDWKCLECKENNFAKRTRCFKCTNPKQ
jgi:hypothetical protein